MLLLLLSHISRVWLCDPIDGSPPCSSIPGILQTRTLEWVAVSFSNAWKWKVKGKSLSRVQLLPTPWTAAYQAPPSMGFSRQEYWSGSPVPFPCLSEKLFISPSIWNEILAGYSNLGCRFFPFSTLNISCHSLLACRVSAERSAVKHVGFPCMLLVASPLMLLKFFVFSFVSLISMCFGLFLLGFVLYGTLYASWTWLTISFSM